MPQNKVISRIIILKLIIDQRYLAIKSLLLALFTSVLEGISTPIVMLILQELGGGLSNSSQLPRMVKNIVELYTIYPKSWHLLILVIVLMSLTIIKNAFLYFSNVSINNLQLNVGLLIRKVCIERFLKLEISFYNGSNIGTLLSFANEQAQRSELLSSQVIEIIREILMIFILLVVLIGLSPVLTIISIISLLLVSLLLKAVLSSVRYYGREAANSIDEFSSFITEMLSGIRVIKSFKSEFRELVRADKYLKNRYVAELQAFKYNSAMVPLTETAGITLLLLLLCVGSNVVSATGGGGLPLLLAYTYTLLRIIPRINHLNGLRSQIALFSGSLEVINDFLSSTDKLYLPDGQKPYKSLTSGINFENVSFAFATNSEPTLKNISFSVQKGTTTALIGSSGSGKSTLADLVMRFYDPDSGMIKINGIDLREYQIASWRNSIAMVSQETFLFHTSIRENIAYGCPQATELEIIEATKKAYAYEFIQELPEGFDTIVGERGARLSGGQRQRIAIARAILPDPDILILDEATSALDSNSERIVQKALEEVSRDRTVIVIAHRLSTIEKADNIVVMYNGRVAEQGTHEELLALEGEYWSLYKSQVSVKEQIIQST
ncbi:MAG: ABC transporter ATP-binding protein [Nostoc sp.]|uniref:ABC transporter ATP-binding protein n=1 Tax=Nostoc sp. TaxID=1180 RepID=UPI002FF5172F